MRWAGLVEVEQLVTPVPHLVTVRDDDERPRRVVRGQDVEQLDAHVVVDVVEYVLDEHEARRSGQSPRHHQPSHLTAGERTSARAQFGAHPVGQSFHALQQSHALHGLGGGGIIDARPTEPHVVRDGASDDLDRGLHQRDRTSQRLGCQVAQVDTVDAQRTTRRPTQSPHQFEQHALARTTRTGHGQASTGPDGQVGTTLLEEIQGFFTVADYNLNNWLSYSEASRSLRFDRDRFATYDKDRDGRIKLNEFKIFYNDTLRYGSGFEPPRAQSDGNAPPKRTPEQLRVAYDQDLDLQLSESELARLLIDYDKPDVPADQVLRSLDIDHDERLALTELPDLLEILHPVVLPPTTGLDLGDRPATIDELFGEAVDRNYDSGATPYPPMIAGPVSHFRRLDLDDDGFISVEDLEELLRPVRISVRVHSVLNTLDLDGDRLLDPHELLRALIDSDND